MDSISLPVVHPAFEKLKRSSNWLHGVAAGLILAHAISHLHKESTPGLYFWCLLIISIDIFILVAAGRDILRQMPKVNSFFRLVEIIFFFGIGILMFVEGQLLTSVIHLLLGIAYSYLFKLERRARSEDLLSFHHTGITIPGLPESRFLLWTNINDVETHYDAIHILPAGDDEKDLTFHLQNNLDFDQVDQIHQFCRFYLGKA